MKKVIILSLLTDFLFLNSCKNTDNPVSPDNSSKVSDGSGVYLMKKGTWFKFKNNVTTDFSTYTNTVIGEKVINGKTYAEIINDQNSDKSYIREEKNVVYVLVYQIDSDSYLETKYIDFSNQNKDESWGYDRIYKNTINRYKNYFIGNDFKYTLKGKEYTATKTRTDTYIVTGGSEMKFATQYNWFIKGIGFVYMNSDYGSVELIDFGTN